MVEDNFIICIIVFLEQLLNFSTGGSLQAVRGGGQIVLKGLYAGLGGNLAGVLP